MDVNIHAENRMSMCMLIYFSIETHNISPVYVIKQYNELMS